MDGDMNDIFQKINSILSDKEASDNLKNILDNFSSSDSSAKPTSGTTESCENSTSSQNTNSVFPDLDINTILKLKTIMDSINNPEKDERSNLLLSLKPYLQDSKKEKIDQYVKFLSIARVFESISPTNSEHKNE